MIANTDTVNNTDSFQVINSNTTWWSKGYQPDLSVISFPGTKSVTDCAVKDYFFLQFQQLASCIFNKLKIKE